MGAITDWIFRFLPAKDGKAYGGKAPASVDDELEKLTAQFLSDISGRITPARLKTILENADQGMPEEQALLCQIIQEREPVIAAHLQTRKLAVTGCGWEILSDKANQAKADEITKILRSAKVGALIQHLLDAIAQGFSGAVIDWEEGGGAVKGFIPVHPTAWRFDFGGSPAYVDRNGQEHALSEHHESQFVLLKNQSKPGLPTRNGILRPLVWMYLFKHSGVAGWMRVIEKFGIPFILGKMADGDFRDDAKRNRVLAALKQIGSDGAGVVTTSTEAEALSVGASESGEMFKSFTAYCDEVITLLILGQLASSSTSSGLSGGDAQSQVRQDILESDGSAVAAAIQQAIVAPLCRFRFGMDDPGDIQFWINYEPPEDLAKKAETWVKLTAATGKLVEQAQAEKEFGVKLVDKPEAAPLTLPLEKNTALLDLADLRSPARPARERALDSIVATALARTVEDPEALATWFGPVASAVRQAFGDLDPETGLDEFKKRVPEFLGKLPGLYQDMDSAAFERNLSSSMISAALNGYSG